VLVKKIILRVFFVLAGLLLMLSYSRADTVSPQAAPIIKTGQSDCYDTEGNSIACQDTGQDGAFRNGMVWPHPRFTDHGNGTVTDTLTGFMWTKDAQQIKGTKKWNDALILCNNFDFAGYTDWRLPNVRELLSLIDFGEHDPALPEKHPFTNVQFIFYWSSTTYDAIPKHSWGVYVYNGYVYNYHKITEGYVWPVRNAK
jgi:hypothetical protein